MDFQEGDAALELTTSQCHLRKADIGAGAANWRFVRVADIGPTRETAGLCNKMPNPRVYATSPKYLMLRRARTTALE